MNMINKPLKKYDFVTLEIKDGILFGHYKDVEVNLEVAKSVVKSRLDYQCNHVLPAIAYINNVKSTTKEARDYLAKSGNQNITSIAIITLNNFDKILGNFFLKVSKPNVPTKLFLNTEDALAWSKIMAQQNYLKVEDKIVA